MKKRTERKGGGPRTPRGDVLRQCLTVAAALVAKPHTVNELAEEFGINARTVYRILRALEAAGWPLETSPAGKTAPGEGRVPMRYSAKLPAFLAELEEGAEPTHLLVKEGPRTFRTACGHRRPSGGLSVWLTKQTTCPACIASEAFAKVQQEEHKEAGR